MESIWRSRFLRSGSALRSKLGDTLAGTRSYDSSHYASCAIAGFFVKEQSAFASPAVEPSRRFGLRKRFCDWPVVPSTLVLCVNCHYRSYLLICTLDLSISSDTVQYGLGRLLGAARPHGPDVPNARAETKAGGAHGASDRWKRHASRAANHSDGRYGLLSGWSETRVWVRHLHVECGGPPVKT